MILRTLKDFRQTWPQLLAADILAKIVAVAVLSPTLALVAKVFLSASGNVAIADEDILRFFLSPIGLAALIVVGAGAAVIAFVDLAVLLTIGFFAARDRLVTYFDSMRFVVRRLPALFGLALQILVRVLLVSLPFFAAGGVVYLALLTKNDINWYLSEKPPAFWLAVTLGGILAAILAAILIRLLLAWMLALPILLFERIRPAKCLSESRARTEGRRRAILIWLAVWVLCSFGLSAVSTGLVAGAARLLIPSGGNSLALVASLVALCFSIAVVVNVLVSFLSAALIALLIVRIYERIGLPASGTSELRIHSTPLGSKTAFRFPRKGLLWGAVAWFAVALLGTVLLARGIDVEDTTTVTAHRGYSAVAPENTIAAVERAIEAGADWIEIDVQETADGIVVVLHDSDLMKIAGVDLKIWNATMADLRDIDVGSRFSPEFADQRVPTLEEVLRLCKGRARVNIELKYYGHEERLEERVVEIVEATGMESDVVLMSLKHAGAQKVKDLRPDWTVGLLSAVALGNLTKLEADFLAVNTSLATGRFVRAAHRSGKPVHVWTVNDPVTMSSMISRGVDSLITDEPALARSVLEQRAAMSAAERLLVRVAASFGVVRTPAKPSTEDDA